MFFICTRLTKDSWGPDLHFTPADAPVVRCESRTRDTEHTYDGGKCHLLTKSTKRLCLHSAGGFDQLIACKQREAPLWLEGPPVLAQIHQWSWTPVVLDRFFKIPQNIRENGDTNQRFPGSECCSSEEKRHNVDLSCNCYKWVSPSITEIEVLH